MKRNIFLMAIAIVTAFVFISCKPQVKETPVKQTNLATFTEEVNGETLVGLKIAGENGKTLIAPTFKKIEGTGDGILLAQLPNQQYKLLSSKDGSAMSPRNFDKVEPGVLFWMFESNNEKFYYFPAKLKLCGPWVNFVNDGNIYKTEDGWNKLDQDLNPIFAFPMPSIIKLRDLKTDSIYYIVPTAKKCHQVYDENGNKVKLFKPKAYDKFYNDKGTKEMENLYDGEYTRLQVEDFSKF